MITQTFPLQYLPIDIFHAQKRLLCELLGESLLNKLSQRRGVRHPALEAIDICDRMINQNGILKWPENESIIDRILAVVLDSYIICKCSSGKINEFNLGYFANYGDEQVQKRLKTRLENENNFLSLMTEFSCGALYYNNRDYQLIALDDTSRRLPDFKLISVSPPAIIAFECKRIMANRLSKKNIKEDIEDTNNKLKCFSIQYGYLVCGVAVLDLSNVIKAKKVTLIQHQQNIPTDVHQAKQIVESLITHRYSSVSGVLILWNEYQQFNKGDTSLFTFHKCGLFVPHQAPKLKILPGIITKDWGYTLGIPIQWRERATT